jgi:serine protease Do
MTSAKKEIAMRILRSVKGNPCVVLRLVAFLILTTAASVFAEAGGGANILAQVSEAAARVAEQASPAVVGIWVDIKPGTEQTALEGPSQSLPNPFGGQSSPQTPQSPQPPQKPKQFPQMQPHEQALGSGFIVSKDGYILTNNHVVGNADLVIVTVGDKPPVKAEVVGTDPPTDLAVIKIQGAADLPVVPLGDSDKLRVGDWVMAIGQPFGLTHTVTKGIISALNRKQMHLTTYEDFIQTDAAINPGNSGGPLINRDGQVVGINTAILGSEGNIGIGFAIPVNMAKDVYEQIVKTGKVTRGYLGVDIQELTSDLAAAFSLPADVNGILVTYVAADSPAEKAGLRQGDVITQFDGRPIRDASLLQSQIASMKPGSQVSLLALRDGKPDTVTVQLGTRPTQPPTTEKEGAKRAIIEMLGLAVQDLTTDLAERLDYQGLSGVVVLAVEDNSIADASGLSAGMLIQEIDRQPVKNVKEFEQALEAAAKKTPILFLVDDQGSHRYVVIDLSKQ